MSRNLDKNAVQESSRIPSLVIASMYYIFFPERPGRGREKEIQKRLRRKGDRKLKGSRGRWGRRKEKRVVAEGAKGERSKLY
jgi:hypothetical protein